MAINLSDKLTADHSENYIMSIRLRSGGLSFSAYSPSVNESFFYRDVEFDRTRPYVSSLKECFFENDFLTWFYKQVNVVCVTSQYTLVPAAVFQEKQKAGLLAFTFSSPEGRCLSNELKDEREQNSYTSSSTPKTSSACSSFSSLLRQRPSGDENVNASSPAFCFS